MLPGSQARVHPSTTTVFRSPIIFLLLLHAAVSAQEPYLYFNKITTQDGLSHNQVNCIHQDRRGFTWIGTNDGLNRFDGKYFTVFNHKPGDSTTISGNIITDILEDAEGILWIATADGGLSCYDYRLPPERQFRQYKHRPGDSASIPVNIINDLAEDRYGFLWLATSGHSLLRFDKAKGRFERPVKSGTKTILALSLGDSDILWAGREGGGILKINTRDLSSYSDPRYNNLYANLPHAAVTALFVDRRRQTWIGSWDKIVYRIQPGMDKEDSFMQSETRFSFINDEIRCFAEDRSGRIWMGGKTSGLQVFNPATGHFYLYTHDAARQGTIAGNTINAFYVDKQGMVWIGTNMGISVYNPVQQPFVQTFLPVNRRTTIYDFHTAGNGDLWIGTSEGLFIRSQRSGEIRHLPLKFRNETLTISKIFEDVDGTIYLGTNYSLFTYEPETGRLSLLPNTEKDKVMSRIIESRIVSIERDTIDGHPVLITVPYGHYLSYYDLVEKRWISRMDSVKRILEKYGMRDNLIRKVYRTETGEVWLAQAKSGLGKWKGSDFSRVTNFTNDPSSIHSISNNHVFDIARDRAGNLWVSTFGGGLNRFDPRTGRFEHIEGSAHLLEGIRIDARGNVWMVSNGQLFRYDTRRRTHSQFTLPDIEKSGGVSGMIYQGKDDLFYVAGVNYFIAFHPGTVWEVSGRPAVCFTDLRIFNKSYSHLLAKKELRLRHDQNYFTFEFSAPSYFNGNIEYQYMLEGFDDDWIDANGRNVVSYSNLEGGKYVFRVRATTRKGNWSDDAATLTISIVPPYWKQWWFFAICLLLAALIIYGLYRYRINELLKRQAIRNKIAQDLHDSVGSTLSSISVYSQVAKIQQQKGNHEELKDVLQRIGVTSTDMISEMNDIVWAINPGNDSMEKILQRMESFARPLLQAKDIAFVFSYEPAILQLNLPMEKRKNFYLIFKEAVNNVLKYSACMNLAVRVSLHQHQLRLEVEDDGRGFDTSQMNLLAGRSLSGNGLTNMRRRAAEMRGLLHIKSAPGRGTIVVLQFPIT